MTVIVLEKSAVALHGELTRWMLEPRTNVFVGSMTAMVRDRLWAKVYVSVRGSGALLLYRADNEQGFRIETWDRPRDRAIACSPAFPLRPLSGAVSRLTTS